MKFTCCLPYGGLDPEPSVADIEDYEKFLHFVYFNVDWPKPKSRWSLKFELSGSIFAINCCRHSRLHIGSTGHYFLRAAYCSIPNTRVAGPLGLIEGSLDSDPLVIWRHVMMLSCFKWITVIGCPSFNYPFESLNLWHGARCVNITDSLPTRLLNLAFHFQMVLSLRSSRSGPISHRRTGYHRCCSCLDWYEQNYCALLYYFYSFWIYNL